MSKKIRMVATLELEYEFDTEGYDDLDHIIGSVATDEFRKSIAKDLNNNQISASDFNIQIVGTDSNEEVCVTIPLKVNPGERNVNGILYEEESYRKALEEYMGAIAQGKLGKLFIDKDYETYKNNKSTKSYYVPFDNAVGIIEGLDLTDYTVLVRLFDKSIYGDIDTDKYRIGCLLLVDTEPVDGKYIVECIRGFSLIPKEDIENGSNNSSH